MDYATQESLEEVATPATASALGYGAVKVEQNVSGAVSDRGRVAGISVKAEQEGALAGNQTSWRTKRGDLDEEDPVPEQSPDRKPAASKGRRRRDEEDGDFMEAKQQKKPAASKKTAKQGLVGEVRGSRPVPYCV